MYPPPYNIDNSPDFMAAVMREHSFAVMTTQSPDGLLATHLPFVYRETEGPHGTLYAHMAKNNPQAQWLNGNHESMVVFSGPHAYISASWYDTPERNVPTWNYISVQAKGRPEALSGDEALREMHTLVEHYEPDGAWSIAQAEDHAHKLMHAIVSFKMDIESLTGIRKMSANKNDKEHARIIKQLIKQGETDTAAAMAATDI